MKLGGSHRCELSLKSQVSIRYRTPDHVYEKYRESGWYIGLLQYDAEWGDPFVCYSANPIYFCPYCGVSLDK